MSDVKGVQAYFLAYDSDRLLGESENSSDPEERRRIIGAFRPGRDGNYYKEILVGFVGEGELQYTLGMASWWSWLKSSIEREETLIDEEFPFDPEMVRVVTAALNLES